MLDLLWRLFFLPRFTSYHGATHGLEAHLCSWIHIILYESSSGTNKNVDSYSGFGYEDFVSEIRSLDIKYVVIGGLAFDYCVSARLSYVTIIVRSATRGISAEREENLMRAAGVEDAEKPIHTYFYVWIDKIKLSFF